MAHKVLSGCLLFSICFGIIFGSVVRNDKSLHCGHIGVPVIITTWPLTEETNVAWAQLEEGGSNVDAVEAGCTVSEMDEANTSVGYGASPDETGETTLDAMIMDGKTHDVGSVAGLRRVKNAIGVARAVMMYTKHTLLVGDLATHFALSMGFPEENLTTDYSRQLFENWRNSDCQPNYRQNVVPDPSTSCGPYSPDDQSLRPGDKQHHERFSKYVDEGNHDTTGMVVMDSDGNVAAGTSTSGMTHKVPGRVGDSPIVGAGSYADNDVGGAAATGDGDVMLRFLPSLYAVEQMAQGHSPSEACQMALQRIANFFPQFTGALIAVNKDGEHGAACYNFGSFPYAVRNAEMEEAEVLTVGCFNK